MEMLLLSFLGPCVKCEWGITSAQESLLTTIVFIVRSGAAENAVARPTPLFPL